MRLHDYAASGNCFKVRLLFALLDRPYERVAVDIFSGDTLTDAFARLNPVRETPVLELDSGDVITQSPAILWYLAESTPFLPDDALGRAHVLQWLAFEQERVMPGLGGTRFRLVTGRASAGDPAIAARLATGREALAVLDAHLTGRTYVVGDGPTIADIALFPYVSVAGDAGFRLDAWPHVAAWLDAVRALPRFADDFEPYPPNAAETAGRSIYG